MSFDIRRPTVDGNEATAAVAHALSETIAIYPLTPSSPLAESCDELAVAASGAVVLVNSLHGPDTAWSALLREAQEILVERKRRPFAPLTPAMWRAKPAWAGGRRHSVSIK
jgi:hypothetical protein